MIQQSKEIDISFLLHNAKDSQNDEEQSGNEETDKRGNEINAQIGQINDKNVADKWTQKKKDLFVLIVVLCLFLDF